jgi:hypothetical protein
MSFAKHIKELNRKIIHNTPEFLGQTSNYKLDKVIHNYSTDLIQAYTLTEINASHNLQQLYCLTTKLPQVTDFSRFISFYNLGQINNFLNIVDYGVSNIGGKEVFGVVLPYMQPEALLSSNLSTFDNRSDTILQYIIIPILEVLVQLHNGGLSHGCINQDNIWVEITTDNTISNIILSNTCLELAGYSQNPIYEPLNRMVVHRSGKTSSKEADCYAVGVLMASLLSCKTVTRRGYDSIVTSKAKLGSYETIINLFFNGNESAINEVEKSTLYWLLHDDESKRWTAVEALKFLRRRHRKVTVGNAARAMLEDISKRQVLTKPLVFSGEDCYSMTEAAISSIRHYDEIRIRVKNGKLVKELLSNENIKPDFISKISVLRSLDGFTGNSIVSKEDMFLTLFITLLDKSMPIKLKDVAVEASAVAQMSRYMSNKPFTSTSNTLNKAIYLNIISKIHGIIYKVCQVNPKTIELPKCEVLPYLSEVGIMSCIHSYCEPNSAYLLNDKICFTISDLLDVLDTFDKDTLAEAAIDEKLFGFILGKLLKQTKVEIIKNSVLDPTVDQFAMFFLLINLSSAISNKRSLKKLSANLYEKLSANYLNKIKYAKLRNNLNVNLKAAADEGNINKMHKILNANKIEIKYMKYMKVLKKVEKLNSESNKKSNHQEVFYNARQQTIRLAGAFFIGILLLILYQIS